MLKTHARLTHYKFLRDSPELKLKTKAIDIIGVPAVDITRNITCHDAQCKEKGAFFTTLNNLRIHEEQVHNIDHPYTTHKFANFEGKSYSLNILKYIYKLTHIYK